MRAMLVLILGIFVWTGWTRAEEPSLSADAWFERDFDTNFKSCSVRENQPAWCSDWMAAVEVARPKTNDMTLPEWLRQPFAANIFTCSTLKTPKWCPDWHSAMKDLTGTPEYQGPTQALTDERHRKIADTLAKEKAWAETVSRIGANRATKEDFDLIHQHIAAGDTGAMELLGWVYASGQGVKRDYARAYEFYGRAVLAGRSDLSPTLTSLWKQLNETQKREMDALFNQPGKH